MSKKRAVEAYKNHLLETDVKRAEQLLQIAQNEASLGDFTIDEVREEAKRLVENQPVQNKQNQSKPQEKFVRRAGSTGLTPNQLKEQERQRKLQARQARRKKMKQRLGLSKKPAQNTGGRTTFVRRKPQAQQQQQQATSTPSNFDASQFVDDTLKPKKPRTLSNAEMQQKIKEENKRRNINQSNIADMQAVNNPNVAPPKKTRNVKRDKPPIDRRNKPPSKSTKLSDFRDMNNTLSNINNVTLASIKDIKNPRLRQNVANNLISQLRELSINKADFSESEKLILKMLSDIILDVDNIRKEIERVTLERENILRELGVSIDDKDEIQKMITRELRIKVNKLAKEKIDEVMREALTYG